MSAEPFDVSAELECDHEWTPVGLLGPYPVEGCTRCNTAAILPTPGHPEPFGVILDALAAAGCDPQPRGRGNE